MASPYKNELGGKKLPPDLLSYGKSISLLKNLVILNSHKKSLVGPNNLKICILQ